MSDQNHAIRDDIAFLRTLAEEGRAGPIVGGSIILAAGLIFGAASLSIAWALSHGQGMAGWAQYVWPVSALAFFAYLMLAKYRQARSGVVRGTAAKAAGAIWSGIGMAMGFIVLSLLIMATRAGDWRIAAAIGPIFLALYGAAWFSAARLMGRRWLDLVAIGSFTMGGITALTFTDPAGGFLVYGLSLLLLAALPGFILVLQARKSAP